MSKPQLLNEGGVTRISLQNERRLGKRLGRPVRVELHYNPDGVEWYQVKAMYDSGDSHVFTGFSWGYSGEGPRGLLEFCQRNDIPLAMKDIVELDNSTKGRAWVWPVPNEDPSIETHKGGRVNT